MRKTNTNSYVYKILSQIFVKQTKAGPQSSGTPLLVELEAIAPTRSNY